MPPTFDLYALQFGFTAADAIRFPLGKTANLFRGQFGKTMKRRAPDAYSRFFAPFSGSGMSPSGLRDPPRPFVLRVSHLDGRTIAKGGRFHAGINVFETREPVLALFQETVTDLMSDRFGAALESVQGHEPVQLELAAGPERPQRVRVHFLTPTELKGADRPEFGVLLARIRDRISTLRSLYGAGPLGVDFKGMGERARRVRMTRCEIEFVKRERRSGSSGERHPLGGFVGRAEYEGDLAEFLPYLEIARWTGVGRQTVWGKGEIACETF